MANNKYAPGTKFLWLAFGGVPVLASVSWPMMFSFGSNGALQGLRNSVMPTLQALPELAFVSLIVLAFWVNRKPENLELSYVTRQHRRGRIVISIITVAIAFGLWVGAAVTSPIIPGTIGYNKMEYILPSLGFLLAGFSALFLAFAFLIFAFARPVRPEGSEPAAPAEPQTPTA